MLHSTKKGRKKGKRMEAGKNLYALKRTKAITIMTVAAAWVLRTYCPMGIAPKELDPFIRAVTFGDIATAEKLLHDGTSLETRDRDNNNGLQLLVMNVNYIPNRTLLDILLRYHPYPRVKNNDGQMPIHMIPRIDNADIRYKTLAKLLEFGARIDDKDGKGYTLLDRLVEMEEVSRLSEFLELFGTLIPNEMIENARKLAFDRGFSDSMVYGMAPGNKKLVYPPGADVNAYDPVTGFSGLHWAILNNDMDVVQELVRRNAHVNQPVRDIFSMKPLHMAILQHNSAIVKFLIEHKASVNISDADGTTPLQLTAHLYDGNSAQEIAAYLLDHGANIDAVNKKGNSFLHLLVWHNNAPMITFVRKHLEKNKKRWNVFIKNLEHETPVDMARRLRRESLLQGLM